MASIAPFSNADVLLVDPSDNQNVTFADQRCGGHVNATTGDIAGYISRNKDAPYTGPPKGYTCPLGQLCIVRNFIR